MLSNEEKLRYASIYLQLFKENEKAEALVKTVYSQNPDYQQAYYWLLSYYYNEKLYDKGINLLSDWLSKHPDDDVTKQQLDLFRQAATQATSPDTSSVDSVTQN